MANYPPPQYRQNAIPVRGIALTVAIVFASIAMFSSFACVDPGHVGVLVSFGEVQLDRLDPGIHVKAPWKHVQQVTCLLRRADAHSTASSRDMQDIAADITVNYNAIESQGPRIVAVLGHDPQEWERIVIQPAIQEATKAVTARYTAEQLITERAAVSQAIEIALRENVRTATLTRIDGATTDEIAEKRSLSGNVPTFFNVSKVSITNFSFSPVYTQAIEQKQVAEQAVKRAENELRQQEIDAKRQVVQATQEAEAARQRASGEADATRTRAQAEADAYKMRLDAEIAALKLLKDIGIEPMFYQWLMKWDGSLPRVMGESSGMTLMLPDSLHGASGERRNGPPRETVPD